jgi:transcriptional regulator with XRE-family HTH domain
VKFIPETIGDAVLAFVRQNYRSNKDAARDMGIGQSYLSSIIHGTRSPTPALLRKMGMALAYVPSNKLDGDMFLLEKRKTTETGSHAQHG